MGIWTIKMTPGAEFTIPAGAAKTQRTLYYFEGDKIWVDEHLIDEHLYLEFDDAKAVKLKNGEQPTELLMLQGRPIGEPVAHHGPFVMNTPEELYQAVVDYQRTRFGGWPWRDWLPVEAGPGPRADTRPLGLESGDDSRYRKQCLLLKSTDRHCDSRTPVVVSRPFSFLTDS